MKRTEELYRRYVVDQQLERVALVETLRRRCDAATVLYPGCFIHVTPSFYFRHIVYVDSNDLARRFFADEAGVRRIVDGRKRYRQPAYMRFIAQDFTAPLPLPEGSFDLLLALYAPGVSRACAKYLRIGGLLLTNDHCGDAVDAATDPGLHLVAVAGKGRGAPVFGDEGLAGYLAPERSDRARVRGRTTAEYYLFERVRR